MIRVAVVGLGRMGRRHVRVTQNLGMNLVGVSDRLVEAMDITTKELGVSPSLFRQSPFELLEEVRPDAVVVATTAPSHCDLVCAAARSGARYILCEKPLATSVDEAERMLAVCRQNGAVLAVNHQMQFMAQYAEIKELAESAVLGGLVGVLVSGSNFGLAMNGSHYFEMFRYMMGGPACSVQAWFDPQHVPNPRGTEFEDRAGAVRVVGLDGRSMFLSCSEAAGHGVQVVYVCRLGQILVDELSGYVRVVHRQHEYRDLPTTRYAMPAIEDIQRVEPADVIAPTQRVWEAMLAGHEFPDGQVGLHAVLCLCAAHTSVENGGIPVRFDDHNIDRNRRYPWA